MVEANNDDAGEALKERHEPVVNVSITDILGIGSLAKNLSPAASKLVEGLNGGVARIFTAYAQPRLEGAARRAEVERDARAATQVQVRYRDDPELVGAMRGRLLWTELRRQENISAAAQRAVEHAEQNDQVDVEDVDPDFVAEWVEGVKDVGDEEVRDLWSRLLAAAPTRKGGRPSKPAVDLLRSLDANTAQMFRDFLRLSAISEDVPLYLDVYRISDSLDCQLLADMGIIREYREVEWTLDELGIRFLVQRGPGIPPTPELAFWRIGPRAKELASLVMPLAMEDRDQSPFLNSSYPWVETMMGKTNEDWLTLIPNIGTAEPKHFSFAMQPIQADALQKKAMRATIRSMKFAKSEHAPTVRKLLREWLNSGHLHPAPDYNPF